ncbi:hypothetical protein AK95_09595 [Paenibacillus sp. LC231]|uniref:hypothetical protein n=1 Tax=Paenibacillus sp. LC231 TaxID=1120679 RepID=UPI0008DC8637|nr:hypothetical protein [Paenibacillus sp. LC231]OIB03860.1 hypothetical protein AK95_09595 [Paenibacillus sp. LC231]
MPKAMSNTDKAGGGKIPARMGAFERIGVPADVDESRSAAVCRRDDGAERIVIAARGYVLIVDPETGSCSQLYFPGGESQYPFASASDLRGWFYTGAGRYFYIVDPFTPAFVGQHRVPEGEEEAGFAFAVKGDGRVYATTYPGSYLVELDASSDSSRTLCRLDSERKYAMTLACGSGGKIYAGLGTTSSAIACFHEETGELEILLEGPPDMPGSAAVLQGCNGSVYGWLPSGENGDGRWYRLGEHGVEPVPAEEVGPSLYKGAGYNKLHLDLDGGRTLLKWQLSDRQVVIMEADGSLSRIPLAYKGGGTPLSPLYGGPDGILYGTSNHPLHLFTYDTTAGRLTDWGGDIVERGGGGNIAAYAAQGNIIVGAAYAGGMVHLLDTAKDWNTEEGLCRNPRLIYENAAVHRPRCAAAHPDGRHVLYGGFPGYGAAGGGLGIVDVQAGQVEMLEHQEIVSGQSTISLAVLPDGRVFGGTSIETPGGGISKAGEAAMYELSWPDRKVIRRWVPIQGAKEIAQLAPGVKGILYGLTSESVFFVYDADLKQVVHWSDLSTWGRIVRQGLLMTEREGRPFLLGLLSRALFTVNPVNMEPELLDRLPAEATSGIACLNGDVYFGSFAELWRYRLEEEGNSFYESV